MITSLLEPCRGEIKFHPKALFLGSEHLPEADRQLFESFYQAPAANWYGHSESLIYGGNCPCSEEYHFYPSYGYMELLDDEGQDVTVPGKEGRIVATGFDNRVMPFIRYDTGDRGVLSAKRECRCGFRGTSLSIAGRGQDVILLCDGTRVSLTAFIFGQHLQAFEKIREMQVIQNQAGELELAIVKSPAFSAKDEKSVIETLQRSVNGKLKLTVDIFLCFQNPQGKKYLFCFQCGTLNNDIMATVSVLRQSGAGSCFFPWSSGKKNGNPSEDFCGIVLPGLSSPVSSFVLFCQTALPEGKKKPQEFSSEPLFL